MIDREEAKREVYDRFRQELRPDRSRKGYVCPICGSGTGKTGTGITENPNSPGHYTCWAGCFKNADAFEIVALMEGQQPGTGDAMRVTYQHYGVVLDAAAAPIGARRPTAQEDFAGLGGEIPPAPAGAAPAPEPMPPQEPQDYTQYYRQCMDRLKDPAAVAYLSFRGISPETAARFWVGYDPAWRSPTALRNGKNPPASPRLIIPMNQYSYVARDIRPGITDYAKMKEGAVQLFNPRALYNDALHPVFITEGEIDALSVLEIGGEAVALGSTSNINKLLEKLKEKRTEAPLVLCLDNDEAGRKAGRELAEGLQRLNISYVTADICGGHKDPNEALQASRDNFAAAIQAAEHSTAARPDNVSDYITRLMSGEIERFKEGATRKTGFSNLDKEAGGVYPGLYVLGAISSLGKTTFVHQMGDQMAAMGEHVLFFSLEQSRLEMVSKSLSRITAQADISSAVTSLSIRAGRITPAVSAAVQTYTQTVGDRMSVIEGNFSCDVAFIGEYTRRYMDRNGVKPVVIVDYLQVLPGDPNQRKTTKELTDFNVTELKRISCNLDIPVFLISSLNRSNYLSPIDFESFKESGGIEYTADVVWGLQLAEIHNTIFTKDTKTILKREIIKKAKAEIPRRVEMVCLKNRYGISSYSLGFSYNPRYDLFTPMVLEFPELKELTDADAAELPEGWL